MNPIYASRRRNDIIIRGLCFGAALFGVTWLALILITLFYNGLAGLSVQIFTENTPPPGSTEGGSLNATPRPIIMTAIGVRLAAPLVLCARRHFHHHRLGWSRRAPSDRTGDGGRATRLVGFALSTGLAATSAESGS